MWHQIPVFYRNWPGEDHQELPVVRDSGWFSDFFWPDVASSLLTFPPLVLASFHSSTVLTFLWHLHCHMHLQDAFLSLHTPSCSWCWFCLNFGPCPSFHSTKAMPVLSTWQWSNWNYHLYCDNFLIISILDFISSWTSLPTDTSKVELISLHSISTFSPDLKVPIFPLCSILVNAIQSNFWELPRFLHLPASLSRFGIYLQSYNSLSHLYSLTPLSSLSLHSLITATLCVQLSSFAFITANL